MIINTGVKVGKGIYSCIKCGKKFKVNGQDRILQPCKKCSGEKFEMNIIFTRSEEGIRRKLDEAMTILEISLFLVEALKIEAFSNVIALQLRLLLCDTHKGRDISLLSKIRSDQDFHPYKEEFIKSGGNDKFINPRYLFDYDQEPIALDDWLNQKILFTDRERDPITIQELIKNSANKHGGAHLDLKLKSKELLSITIADNYLIEIGKYLLDQLNYNYMEDIKRKIMQPIFELAN